MLWPPLLLLSRFRLRFFPDGGGASFRRDETVDNVSGMKIGIACRLSIDDQTRLLAVRLANHVPIGVRVDDASLYRFHAGGLAGIHGRIGQAGILPRAAASIGGRRVGCAAGGLAFSFDAIILPLTLLLQMLIADFVSMLPLTLRVLQPRISMRRYRLLREERNYQSGTP